jgi:hypothetical protein
MPFVLLLSPLLAREGFLLALGAMAGMCFCMRGAVLLRRRPLILTTHLSTLASSPDAHIEPAQEVIRLSSVPAPERSIEMTSQARIAAALARAGVASPSSWAMPQPVLASAAAASSKDLPTPSNDAWKIGFMICGGSALTLTCLYLLFARLVWL